MVETEAYCECHKSKQNTLLQTASRAVTIGKWGTHNEEGWLGCVSSLRHETQIQPHLVYTRVDNNVLNAIRLQISVRAYTDILFFWISPHPEPHMVHVSFRIVFRMLTCFVNAAGAQERQ